MSTPESVSRETTLMVRDACLCLHTQRAARALARRFDVAFRDLGITSGQFSLMMSLNRPDPPTLGSAAAFLAMDRTTMTAALKPLQRRRLVKVAVDKEDHRARRLALTGSGRKLLAQAVPIWIDEHGKIDRELAEFALDDVRSALSALTK